MSSILLEPASVIAERIRNKELTALEAVDQQLARLDDLNPEINAVVSRCDEAAREVARQADEALAEGLEPGPLHGVPVTVSDTFETLGLRSTAGTAGLKDKVPQRSAIAVQRLLRAGAILVGKTNTAELGLSYDTDNPVFGRTRNPYDRERSAGGGSGGAAAAVAAGLSAMDMGCDAGGGVRLPAHFCGVAALKPTFGRIPRTGLLTGQGTPLDCFTHVGPIARSVQDLETALSLLSGPDWRDCGAAPIALQTPETVDLKGLRVAFYLSDGVHQIGSETAALVQDCARLLADSGARLSESRPGGLERGHELFNRLLSTDGAAWARHLLEQSGTHEPGPALQWVERAAAMPERSARDWTEMQREIHEFRQNMLAFLGQFNVILTPMHAGPAPTPEQLNAGENGAYFGFAQTFSLTGWPAVTVRVGSSSDGLPIGIQVVAQPWRDDVALRVARLLEEAMGGWQAPGLAARGFGSDAGEPSEARDEAEAKTD
jgi:amidase